MRRSQPGLGKIVTELGIFQGYVRAVLKEMVGVVGVKGCVLGYFIVGVAGARSIPGSLQKACGSVVVAGACFCVVAQDIHDVIALGSLEEGAEVKLFVGQIQCQSVDEFGPGVANHGTVSGVGDAIGAPGYIAGGIGAVDIFKAKVSG